ncbi:MAG: PLDc N-terminal domain-containing protein [Thiohalocapsa sp.]
MGIGIAGLVVLVIDIYAIVMILDSTAQSVEKLIWALIIILLPVLGVVVWYFAGPGKKPF